MGEIMTIGAVVQRGSSVYVYSERGSILCVLMADGRPGQGLMGYTSTTVSIRRGSTLYIYSEKGSLISAVPAGR